MLVVLTVMIIIGALAFPAVNALLAAQRKSTTFQLCVNLASAISAYEGGRMDIYVPPPTAANPGGSEGMRQLWFFTGDPQPPPDPKERHLLDGDPETDTKFSDARRAEARRCGYRGPAIMLDRTWPAFAVDRQKIMRDRWGNRLHVAYGDRIYRGMGIWSEGPDGIPGNADDICSWKDGP
jgi:hypothetical protein